MNRLRLLDLRLGRLPSALGICASDINAIAQRANAAESRLIMCREAGDEGWWGSFAEMAFTVSQSAPYLTLPRNVARLEMVSVCDRPIDLQNSFYEYLRFGNGRLPKQFVQENHRLTSCYARNNAPGFVDLTNAPQYVAVYITDPADDSTRVLVQGKDPLGQDYWSLDGPNRVKGFFVTCHMPFTLVTDTAGNPIPFSQITGYQKGGTVGAVQFQQMDPTTGATSLLHTMDPSETTGWYRRYYFDSLPFGCCHSGNPNNPCTAPPVTPPLVQVTAIVKLDPVPVRFDTDYFVLQNAEAIIEECQVLRYEEMDTAAAKGFAISHHRTAIGLLNGELAHYMGVTEAAVSFKPFGSASLERQRIGSMT